MYPHNYTIPEIIHIILWCYLFSKIAVLLPTLLELIVDLFRLGFILLVSKIKDWTRPDPVKMMRKELEKLKNKHSQMKKAHEHLRKSMANFDQKM